MATRNGERVVGIGAGGAKVDSLTATLRWVERGNGRKAEGGEAWRAVLLVSSHLSVPDGRKFRVVDLPLLVESGVGSGKKSTAVRGAAGPLSGAREKPGRLVGLTLRPRCVRTSASGQAWWLELDMAMKAKPASGAAVSAQGVPVRLRVYQSGKVVRRPARRAGAR